LISNPGAVIAFVAVTLFLKGITNVPWHPDTEIQGRILFFCFVCRYIDRRRRESL
jgi:hypothetical protein